jgi:hypothetical protein
MTATRTNHAATTNDGLVVRDITLGQSRRDTESPAGRDEFTAWPTCALREHRTAWRKEQAQNGAGSASTQDDSNSLTQWAFERVGHISLGDRVLVVSAFGRAREQRFTARSAMTEGA